jgi:micrococcal nuclease
MDYRCDHCGYGSTIPDRYIGKTIRCPKCKAPEVVSGTAEETQANEKQTKRTPKKRYRRKSRRAGEIFGAICLLAFALRLLAMPLLTDENNGSGETEFVPSGVPDHDYVTVRRVVDGDTLLLKNGARVRLIGVDTPEVHQSKKLYRDADRSNTDVETIQALGRESSAFTKKLAHKKRIRLEYDLANSHIGHMDRYGRILAYVYLEDGRLLNAEIIRQGYGNAYTRYPFNQMERFRQYEREAMEQGRGLWIDETPLEPHELRTYSERGPPSSSVAVGLTVYVTRSGLKYHRAGCRHLRRSKVPMSLEEAKAQGYTPCAVCNPAY